MSHTGVESINILAPIFIHFPYQYPLLSTVDYPKLWIFFLICYESVLKPKPSTLSTVKFLFAFLQSVSYIYLTANRIFKFTSLYNEITSYLIKNT